MAYGDSMYPDNVQWGVSIRDKVAMELYTAMMTTTNQWTGSNEVLANIAFDMANDFMEVREQRGLPGSGGSVEERMFNK